MVEPYAIVFSGQLTPGADPRLVKARLARALGQDAARVERLFDRGRHVLKRAADLGEAKRYQALLARAGIRADLEGEASAAPKRPDSQVEVAVEPIRSRTLFLLGLPFVTAGALVLFATGPLLAGASLLAGVGAIVALHAWAAWLPLPALLAADLVLAGAGLLGAAFLLKPLVPAKPATDVELEPEHEPELFELASAVCEAIGAPPVHAITLATSPQVTVRRHAGDGLELAIGLPLLRAATVAELSGLIAHAASPWAPRLGSRIGRLLTWCDRWLEAAAQEADFVDCRLERLRSNRLTVGMRRVADAGKTLPRALLRAERRLAGRHLARLITDADAVQAALVGTGAFDHGWRSVRLLSVVASRLLAAVPQWHASGRFPADLATRAATVLAALPAESTRPLLVATDHTLRAAGLIDDRARRRLRPAVEGLSPFTCACPARALVRRLGVHGRRQTLRVYRNELGIAVTPNLMQAAGSAAHEAVEVYFDRVFDPFVPFRPQFREDWDSPGQVTAEWREVVGGLGRLAARGEAAMAQLDAADAALIEHMQRLLLVRAGRPLRDGGERAEEMLHAACRREEGQVDAALGTLVPYTARVTRRLCAALTLLAFPESQGRVGGAATALAEARYLTAFLDRTAVALPALRRMRWHLFALAALLAEPGPAKGPLADRIGETCADLRQEVTAVGLALRDVPHPLLGRRTPFLEWALAGVPEGDLAERLLDRAEALLERLLRTQEAVLARLVATAGRVEEAWGLRH